MAAQWIDLLNPTVEELHEHAPRDLEETAVEPLVARPQHDDEPRPTLQGHGDYVFGIFLLARAVPGILPRLSQDEALEVTRIYSVCGRLPAGSPMITSRPFRSPHHTISNVGLVGGGRWPRPGEIRRS